MSDYNFDSKFLDTDQKNILEVAIATKSLSVLVNAVKAASLDKELSGPGPITVFAPTDDAFNKLSKEELDELLYDKNKLRKVLLTHVVPKVYNSKDIPNGPTILNTDANAIITLTKDEAGVKITYRAVNAKVTKPDVVASNGIIHVIDSVLLGII